jgi:hypothetical protein
VSLVGADGGLLGALDALRTQVDVLRLPLDSAAADEARTMREELLDQLDDYLLPRLRRLDAPILAVVGGSTGAGKSTLVNSLAGQRVSQAGVLRPTTRAPVLVHNPADAGWFEDDRILPGLARTRGAPGGPATLHLVASESVPRGLALLDAPDVDSVETGNRELAGQLLSAADLWIWVTTAARYADAVPWAVLTLAVERTVAIAVVLDRVPPEAVDEVRTHLASMLSDHGLGGSPLFLVEETTTYDGQLPVEQVDPLRDWLHRLAEDADARAAVVRQTLTGALDSLRARIPSLAGGADAQAEAVVRLRDDARTAYAAAGARVAQGMEDGTVLRGEVLARWQEFVGTGDLMRALESRVSRIRDRVGTAVRGKRTGQELSVALETGVEALVRAAAEQAAEQAAESWAARPAGAGLLAAQPDGGRSLGRPSPDLAEVAARTVRDWQAHVLQLVGDQAQGKRSAARALALGINSIGVLVMVVVFSHTGGLTGGEIATATGASVASQKVLEAVLGDQAVRTLAQTAREDLLRRIDELLAAERSRYDKLLDAADVDTGAGERLRSAVRTVEAAR